MSTRINEPSTSSEVVQSLIVPSGDKKVIDLSSITIGSNAITSTLNLGTIYAFWFVRIAAISDVVLSKMVMKWKAIRDQFALDGGKREMVMVVDGFEMHPGTKLGDTDLNDRRFGAALGVFLIIDPTKAKGDLANGPPMFQSMPEVVKTYFGTLKFAMVNGCHLMWKMYLAGLGSAATDSEIDFTNACKEHPDRLVGACIMVDWLTFCRTAVKGVRVNENVALNTFYNVHLKNMRGASYGLMSNNNASTSAELRFPDMTALKTLLNTPNIKLPGKVGVNRARYDAFKKAIG